MRNIVQYPITHEEVIQVLEREIKEEQDKKLVGGIDGFVLHTLLEYVKQHPEDVMKQFGEYGKQV